MARTRITNTQQQTQKTHVDVQGYSPHSDAPRYVFIGVLFAGLLVSGVWFFTNGAFHILMVLWASLLLCGLILWGGHWIYHELYMMIQERKYVELSTHFYSIDGMIIGDHTTHGYELFHSNKPIEPKQEMTEEPLPYPHDTYEQLNDRSVYDYKKQGDTWDTIAEKMHMTVGQVRAAKDRHEKRVQKGETYE